MLMKEFWEILSHGKRGWKVDEDGGIRKYLHRKYNNMEFCPVTYAAKKVTGKDFSVAQYHQAGRAIKLPERSVQAIVDGADGVKNKSRKKMLDVLNLNRKGK